LDETVTYNLINFTVGDDNSVLPNGQAVQTVRIPSLVCPSENNDVMRTTTTSGVVTPHSWPLNYGVNLGPWFVFDPTTGAQGTGGPGAFYPNSALKTSNFTDGMSKTLMLAEFKAFQPQLSGLGATPVPAIPTLAAGQTINSYGATIAALGGTPKLGATLQLNTGHTEWGDGRGGHTGFTTTAPPNTYCPYTYTDGNTYDVDFINESEGSSLTIPSFSAITSRSYHPTLVNTCFMDGSVHTISNTINLLVWQALSTRASAENPQIFDGSNF
jgi:hypothetical protein